MEIQRKPIYIFCVFVRDIFSPTWPFISVFLIQLTSLHILFKSLASFRH